jgi:hypothetical protein
VGEYLNVLTNLDERIANITLDVIRFIPNIASKRTTLYSNVKKAWKRTITSMPAAEYWSNAAIIRTVCPMVDLDLSIFTASLAFLINTDCIVMEIRIIKPKTKISVRGNTFPRDSVNVSPNDLSIT